MRVIFLAILLLTACIGTTDAMGKYVSDESHFSLEVPVGWIRIDDEALRAAHEFAKGQTAEADKVQYECAFQPAIIDGLFTGPRILVNVWRGHIRPDDVHKDSLTACINTTFDDLVRDVNALSRLDADKLLYDEQSHTFCISIRAEDTFDSTPTITCGVSLIRLTSFGFVQLHCLAPESQWADVQPVFLRVVRSFDIAEDYRFRNSGPLPSRDFVRTFLRAAGIALAFSVFAVIVSSLRFISRKLFCKHPASGDPSRER